MKLLSGVLIASSLLTVSVALDRARRPATEEAVASLAPTSAAAAAEDRRADGEARPKRGEGRARDRTPSVRRRPPATQPAASADEPLTPDQTERMMQFARENLPNLYERLDRLRTSNPEAFRSMLRKMRGRLLPMMELKSRNPRAAERMIAEHRARLAIADLAARYRRARNDAERSRLRRQLEQRIQERFDRHQERARQEIDELRKRLDEQARQLTDREQRREELIRREIERTLQEAARSSESDDEQDR